MDNTKNLDDYLAGLGISEPGEAVLPAPPQPLPPDEARTAEAGDAELGPGEAFTAESGGQGGAAPWSMPSRRRTRASPWPSALKTCSASSMSTGVKSSACVAW